MGVLVLGLGRLDNSSRVDSGEGRGIRVGIWDRLISGSEVGGHCLYCEFETAELYEKKAQRD
jgi:hypothetical protein